jgi:drug/metabolite transporter (DMT)-like permease
MQAGRAVVIAYTMPMWAILLGRLILGERVTSPRLWALAFGFAGLLLLGEPIRAHELAALGLVVAALGLTGWSKRQPG